MQLQSSLLFLSGYSNQQDVSDSTLAIDVPSEADTRYEHQKAA